MQTHRLFAAAATLMLMLIGCAATRAADVPAKAAPAEPTATALPTPPAVLPAPAALPTPPAAQPGTPVIILKLDDITRSGAHGEQPISPRWQKCVDFLMAENIRASLGIIGNSLEGDAPAYFNWIKDLHKKGFEFWNHGYENKENPFFGPPLEEQKAAIEKTQRLAREKCGITLAAFGPHWGGTDASTEAVLAAIPEIRVWFFGPAKPPRHMVSLKRTVNLEYPTLVPNFEKFKADFEKRAAEQPYLCLQGHPNAWDDARWAAFVEIVKFMKEKGCKFMTAGEYVATQKP